MSDHLPGSLAAMSATHDPCTGNIVISHGGFWFCWQQCLVAPLSTRHLGGWKNQSMRWWLLLATVTCGMDVSILQGRGHPRGRALIFFLPPHYRVSQFKNQKKRMRLVLRLGLGRFWVFILWNTCTFASCSTIFICRWNSCFCFGFDRFLHWDLSFFYILYYIGVLPVHRHYPSRNNEQDVHMSYRNDARDVHTHYRSRNYA